MENEITHEKLLELLRYEPETGIFAWAIYKGSRAKVGQISGRPLRGGYVGIRIANNNYLAHRLAWFYVYGKWPDDQIDHINRVGSDNRVSNLRVVTCAQNHQNCDIYSSNTSGFAGVHWCSRDKRWRATISFNGKKKALGNFLEKAAAIEARATAKKMFHPLSKM